MSPTICGLFFYFMQLEVFKFEQNEIRTQVDTSGNPLFCVKDICNGLLIGNVTDATKPLKITERYSIKSNTSGGEQIMTFTTESGLYKLIMQSRKPEAQAFKDWICEEVLPSIRKTGTYSVKPVDSYQIEDPIERAQRWIEEQKEKILLLNENKNLKTALDSLSDWASIVRVAKFNKVSEKTMNWRTLKAKSKELGYEIKIAPCPRYGTKKLYHVNVFRICYPELFYNFDDFNLEN